MVLKKIRLIFLIVGAFWKKEKKLIILSTILALGVFFLITKVLPYIPRPNPTQRTGVVGNYSFDNLPISILKQASSGLTKIDETGKPVPSLAKDWDVLEDGKVYVFHLEDNIFWQDGTEVMSEEINYNLPGVEVEKVDNKTLKFKLTDSFSPFPTLLSDPIFKEHYVGTSRYQIKKVEKNGPFISKLLLVGPNKNILYSFYPTENMAFWAYQNGEIDVFPDSYTNPFDQSWWDRIVIEEIIRKDQYIGLFLNTRDKYLGDKNLRQALAYATLKPTDDTRTLGPINPNSWAYNSDVKRYEANAKQAQKLFDKFKKDQNIEELKLKIDTTSSFLLLAEQVKENWKEVLGIETEIALVDRIPSDFQVLLIISQIPNDPDQYSFWHSTQESNLTGYKSPKIDKILEDARRISELSERKEKYFDFQKFLLEDCPVIFFSHPKVLTIKRKSLASQIPFLDYFLKSQ